MISENSKQPIRFVDSHTEGEPTRVIVSGGPAPIADSILENLDHLRRNDWFRRTINNEPRGWDALVSAWLCPAANPSCTAGIVFMNNSGYLNMCGHGLIGVAVTLHHLGQIGLGRHRFETVAGIVEVEIKNPNEVEIENVPSYRWRKNVAVDVDGVGTVTGDIAWGGNWFFLADSPGLQIDLANLRELTQLATSIRESLVKGGFSGKNGGMIDHIELFGAPTSSACSKNFVLCPGGAYDRSPCGTGTSAKVACLADDNKLKPGETWFQESIIGSRFAARYQRNDLNEVIPFISGRAFITAEGTFTLTESDPFRNGIC